MYQRFLTDDQFADIYGELERVQRADSGALEAHVGFHPQLCNVVFVSGLYSAGGWIMHSELPIECCNGEPIALPSYPVPAVEDALL